MQRAIPPDQPERVLLPRDGFGQREAVGDLNLAADNYAGAVEAFGAALSATDAHDVPSRVRLLLKLAESEYHRGASDAAEAAARRARVEGRVLEDGRVRAAVAARLAAVSFDASNYRRSLRYARYAYAVLRDTDEHRTVGNIALTLGSNMQRLGQPHAAIEWFQNAAATFRRIEHAEGLVIALNNLGITYKNLREWREAVRFLEQALAIDERKGLYARMRSHHQSLGLIRYRLGQWDLADEHFRHSLRIAREVGHPTSEAQALLALGMLCRRRRQYERAGEHYSRALELARQTGAQRESQLAREFLAEIELDRGQGAAALALLEPALEEARESAPHGDMTMELETRVGLAMQWIGRLDEAHAHGMKGLALAERLGDRVEHAIALRTLARLEALRGQAAAMERHLRDAIEAFDRLGESYEHAITLAEWGEYLLLLPASSRLRLALEPVSDAARRASAMFRQLGVVSLAAEALLTLARLESEREHYDQALSLLEQAELWLTECTDSGTEERLATLRRDIERQYVAVSLSTCNEFRALEEANRLFRETNDMEGLLAQIVKLAVEHSGGDRGFLAFSSTGGRLDVVAQHGLGRDRARRVLRVLEEVGGARLAENGPTFSSRVAADPRFGAALTEALEGVGSLVCVPLNFPSQSVGLVYVDRLNDNLLGAFRQRELNMLAVLANSAAVAIVEAQRSLLLTENQQLRDKLRPSPGTERIVSISREIADILLLLRKVGDSNATVLFMGETGTGKGLFAQVVHETSNRRDHPFVQVNCAALPEQLLESELFGYVHGAFTGATRDKTGLFEEAAGGTIFLDEIEKIPEAMQAKLLHVLDRGEIRPVGATRTRKVDARVICATSSDLRERIREGRFLEDLYYRLNDITVRVPSLRERREDIPVLAQHFAALYSRQMDKTLRGFTPEVMRTFLSHEWRGNVRELEKLVKRMVVLADEGDTLGLELLPAELRDVRASEPAARAPSGPPLEGPPGGRTLRSGVSELEKQMIAGALARHRGNKARVARELGVSYPTLLNRIRTYRLEAPQEESRG
ncbi:MAG: sigma 54-interacting transcriptional regulator [Candidatus Eisenbacteria bacterium]|nr:sigma 54-interacting transcriptional regulator [Candidatus Eisenbacteria bacterium]